MNSPKVDRHGRRAQEELPIPPTTMNLVFITRDALAMTVNEHTKSLWPTECGKLFSTMQRQSDTHRDLVCRCSFCSHPKQQRTIQRLPSATISPTIYLFTGSFADAQREDILSQEEREGKLAFSNAYTTHSMCIFVGDLHLSISILKRWAVVDGGERTGNILLNNHLLLSCRKRKDLNNSRRRIIISMQIWKALLDTSDSPSSWNVSKICIYEKLVPWSLKSRCGSVVLERIYGRIN